MTATASVIHAVRYPGFLEKISLVRADLAGFLGACPVLDDARMVVSELASNAVLHSRSRDSTAHVLRRGPGVPGCGSRSATTAAPGTRPGSTSMTVRTA